jgi:PAS domain S-box-containing protein
MGLTGTGRDRLHHGEEHFRLLVEAVRDYALFMLDENGHVVSWNAGAQLIKGYSSEEILGRHFSIFYPPDALRRGWPAEELRRARTEGRVEDEGWRVRKDGTRFWASVVITAVRAAEGRLLGFAKVTRDLTERRRAEEALRRREHQLAEAQALAQLGSWELDVASGAVLWSDEMYRIFGLETGTPVTLGSFLEHVHAEDRERVRSVIEAAIRTTAGFEVEHRIVRPDGGERIVRGRGHVVVDGEGAPVRLYGTGQDVTEQRAAEASAYELIRAQAARAEAEAAAGRLRESEARFRMLADTAPVMVWMAGPDGSRTFVNSGWLEFTGRPVEQELGSGWQEGMHADDVENCRRAYAAAWQGRAPFRTEYRLRRRDGRYRWLLDQGVPRFTPDGAFAGYVGTSMDIHERIEQQAALEQNTQHLEQVTLELEETVQQLQQRTLEQAVAREQAEAARRLAEEASRAKSQFLAVMSHELRTPLNAILGFTDLLAGEIAGPLTETQRQHLERIHGSSLHLLELINRVLRLSQIEAGREQLHVQDVDVAALARECVQIVEPAASRKALYMHFEARPGEIAARTDAGMLRQILFNLLNNAVRFTDRGGIETRVEAGDGWLRIDVRDTGIGIPPEFVGRVFAPFTQVEAMPARGRGGTGLGLSVTRELCRLLGGSITVESRPEQGSTFTVRLPRTAPTGGRESATPDAAMT